MSIKGDIYTYIFNEENECTEKILMYILDTTHDGKDALITLAADEPQGRPEDLITVPEWVIKDAVKIVDRNGFRYYAPVDIQPEKAYKFFERCNSNKVREEYVKYAKEVANND